MKRVIDALLHPITPLLVLVVGMITILSIWLSLPESDFAHQVQAMKTAQAPPNVAVAYDEPIVTLAPRPTRTMMFMRRPTITALPADTLVPQPTVTPWPTATPLLLGAVNNIQWPTPTLHLVIPVPLVPTEISLPSTDTPRSASDSGVGFSSGGLGLSQLDWAQGHIETSLDYQVIGTGYDNKYDVMFQAGNVWVIERQWGSNELPLIDVVEAESKTLIPSDSQFIETYSPIGRPETTVNLYFSESLKSRFKNEDSSFGNWWTGGEPGNFTVQYNVYDGRVGRMIIGIGNNP